MIKGVAENELEGPLVFLGLSAENLRLLQEGRLILVQMSELGFEGRIAIFYGETEEQMLRDLKNQGFILASTKVKPDA